MILFIFMLLGRISISMWSGFEKTEKEGEREKAIREQEEDQVAQTKLHVTKTRSN